ncbi:MAG: type II secretion system inner membrane protein GspF [Trichlorobacter sp.]
MSTFQYKGYTTDGRSAVGTLEADSVRTAREQLRSQNILASEIAPEQQDLATGPISRFRRRIPVAELSLFTRRLATLTAASVPLHEALQALHQQERHPELRAVLARVTARLAEGMPLARAFAEEPQVFKENYVAMVSAGEAGGALDRVLLRLADFLERQDELRRTVSSAMAYPALMALVGGGVMLFLLTFVIPKITGIFADSKATLPFLTVALLAVSNTLRTFWWLLALAVAGMIWLYRRLIRRPDVIAARDRWLVRLPLVGRLLQTLILARFTGILGLLLSSGVPLLKSLEISSAAVVNRTYQTALTNAGVAVAEGGSLSAALSNPALFPPLLTHLIAVGERSGTLVENLETAGHSFEREFESSTTRLVSLLEPVMILVMGLTVGLVVVAVLLPIFQLNQLVR